MRGILKPEVPRATIGVTLGCALEAEVEVKERVYDVDSFWEFVCQPENVDRHFELINGELVEMPAPGEEHGFIAGEIAFQIRRFDSERKHGILTVGAGYYSQEDRSTVLGPDVAFRRTGGSAPPLQEKWAPQMPDLAVEIKSPSNTLAELRRKAAIYLRQGTQLVWIVMPKTKSAEVHRLEEGGEIRTDVIGAEGALTGEGVLPGFRLELSALFV